MESPWAQLLQTCLPMLFALSATSAGSTVNRTESSLSGSSAIEGIVGSPAAGAGAGGGSVTEGVSEDGSEVWARGEPAGCEMDMRRRAMEETRLSLRRNGSLEGSLDACMTRVTGDVGWDIGQLD